LLGKNSKTTSNRSFFLAAIIPNILSFDLAPRTVQAKVSCLTLTQTQALAKNSGNMPTAYFLHTKYSTGT
jgi:hypothetical protein